MFKNRKAAGLIEYAIIIGTISLALTTMNVYIKRGIQARIKDITHNSIADADLVRNFLGAGLGEDRFRDRVSSDFTTATAIFDPATNTTIFTPTTTTINVQGGTTTTDFNEHIHRSGRERIVEPLSFWNSPNSTVPGSRGQPRNPPYPDRGEVQGEVDERINEWQGEVELPPDSNQIDPEQPVEPIEEALPPPEEWPTPYISGGV